MYDVLYRKVKIMLNTEVFKNTMLRKRLISHLFVIIGYYPISPLITKLTGLNLPLTLITIMCILESLTGMVQIIFKKCKLYRLLNSIILVDIINVLAIILYYFEYVNAYVFVVSWNLMFITQCILVGAFNVTLDDMVSKKCPDLFKDYLITKMFLNSFGKTSILIVTLVLGTYYPEVSNLTLSGVLILLSIKFQVDLYLELKRTYVRD